MKGGLTASRLQIKLPINCLVKSHSKPTTIKSSFTIFYNIIIIIYKKKYHDPNLVDKIRECHVNLFEFAFSCQQLIDEACLILLM